MDTVIGALGESLSWLWPFALVIGLVCLLGRASRKPEATVDELLARDHAERLAAVMRPTVARRTGRECYCPPGRWLAWKQGLDAGPDGIVGTEDDVEVDPDVR